MNSNASRSQKKRPPPPLWAHPDTTTGAPNSSSARPLMRWVLADLEVGAPTAPVPRGGCVKMHPPAALGGVFLLYSGAQKEHKRRQLQTLRPPGRFLGVLSA